MTVLFQQPNPLGISPPRIQWYLRIQGECTEIFCKRNYSDVATTAPRSTIHDFTRAARQRMLRLTAKIDWGRIGKSLFITLTYPDSCGVMAPKARSMHRHVFLRSIEKYLQSQVGTLWRVEWQRRKSGARKGEVFPHVHMVMVGVEYIPWRVIRKAWRDSVHVKGHLCTDVQSVQSGEAAARYVAKYCAKLPSLDRVPYLNNEVSRGRHWGMTRKHLFPMHNVRALQALSDEQAEELRLLASMKFAGYDPLLGGGFTLFGGKNADAIFSKYAR